MEDIANKVFEPESSRAPIVSQQPGAGTQLFVINLCASIAPVSTTGRNIPGLENYRLYQVARVEDGRTRHRLRLGFFTNEAHAERVLTVVRQQYPTAFTASLSEEDRRFTRGYLPESAPVAAAPKRPQVASVPSPPAAPIPTPAAPKPAVAKAPAAVTKPQAPAKKPAEEVVELTWEPDAAAKAAAASNTQPKIQALIEIPGLDDMSWNDAPPAASKARATPSEPLAIGLLSGKFAALDTSKLKAAPPSKPVTAKPATPPAPVAVPPKLDTASSLRVPALTFSDPEPTAAKATSQAPAQPYHVGKGLDLDAIDDFQLDIGDEPPAKVTTPAPPQKPAATAARKPAPTANNVAPPAAAKKAEPMAKPAPAANNSIPAAKPAVPLLSRETAPAHPNLDSTQTIRALTSEELNDDTQEKWFAIQLAASEQPVNLDTMPHLDIFEAYSLYSVATAGSGKIVHSLRLGFFKEAVSAEAVSGYLKTFFASPTVLRISVAEQARFKDAPQPHRPSAAEPKNNVVPLNNARAGRAPVVPTITMEVEIPRIDPMATGAFRAQSTGSLNSATGTFKPGATGTFKPGATGTFKPNATGSFKLDSTGSNRAMSEGRVAAKAAAPATRRSEPTRGNTGKHQTLKKSLAQELMEEARETELSESGVRKLPQNSSLLSRLLGKKK